jgi:hypothetical protein
MSTSSPDAAGPSGPQPAHLTVTAVGASGAVSPGTVLGLYHPKPTS